MNFFFLIFSHSFWLPPSLTSSQLTLLTPDTAPAIRLAVRSVISKSQVTSSRSCHVAEGCRQGLLFPAGNSTTIVGSESKLYAEHLHACRSPEGPSQQLSLTFKAKRPILTWQRQHLL